MPSPAPSRVLITGAGAQLASALRQRFAPAAAVTALTRARPGHHASRRCGSRVPRRPAAGRAQLRRLQRRRRRGAPGRGRPGRERPGRGGAGRARPRRPRPRWCTTAPTSCSTRPSTPGPLPESAPVRPRSVYAQSKLLGEIYARQTPRHYVLRVESLFGGTPAKSSLDRMAATLRSGGVVRAFCRPHRLSVVRARRRRRHLPTCSRRACRTGCITA